MIMIIVINVLQVITCTHARDHHLSFVAESIWRECLVGSRFFLRRRTEQENASVLFSHILQPKSEFLILFFLSLLFLFRILWLLVSSCEDWVEKIRRAVKPWSRETVKLGKVVSKVVAGWRKSQEAQKRLKAQRQRGASRRQCQTNGSQAAVSKRR